VWFGGVLGGGGGGGGGVVWLGGGGGGGGPGWFGVLVVGFFGGPKVKNSKN